jgi:uncharacterized protein
MSILDHFSLPFSGMKDGFHVYDFEVENDFFKSFEHSPIQDGRFQITVEADKRPGITDLDIIIDGHIGTTCDRCLADINLPVYGEYHLVVKISDEVSDDDEIIFLPADQPKLYLAQVFYELICVSLPLINTYDCEYDTPKPCNEDILSKISLPELEEKEEPKNGNIWGDLKGILPDS